MTTYFSTLLTAVVVAWLTALIAGRRFYRERWWDKKYEAYASILDSLHHMSRAMKQDYLLIVDDGLFGGKQKKDDIREKYKESRAELLRLTDVGEFIISKQAVFELRNLLATLGASHEHYSDYISGSSVAVEESLNRIRSLAQKDLNPSAMNRLCGFRDRVRSAIGRGDAP